MPAPARTRGADRGFQSERRPACHRRRGETHLRAVPRRVLEPQGHATAEFPHEFHAAMAADGWLGITMPEELGGSNLGVTEAAIMMNTVASGGGGAAAMSTLQINLFAPHPIVVLGTPEQKKRMLRAADLRLGENLLRRDGAERRPQHDADQDLREEGRRRLRRQRQQDLDLDRAGRRQHPAADAHDGVRGRARSRPTA